MTDSLLAVRRRARRTFALLCLWIPLGAFVAIAVVQLALLPALPETVAIHWGLSGEANGFGPAWTYPVITLAIGGGITALFAGTALFEMKSPTRRTRYRFLGAVIGAETGLIGVMMLGLPILQVGLDDASDAANSLWVMGIGIAAAAILGLAYFFVLEEPPSAETASADVDPLPLADTESAVWMHSVSISRAGGIVLGALLAATDVMVIVLTLALLRDLGTVPFAMWGTLVLMLVVTALVLTSLTFRVRVDDAGLTVRTPAGWPKVHTPTERITSASVVEVSPMAEFGGWGYRFGANGTGFVLRAGEGIRIGREGGNDLTITVDDAETAVALLRRNMARRRGET